MIAVRTPRHDVIRRGWLAAILLLVLACSLPLGKQRKCFGGLSICSGGSPSPVVLRAPPPPASCSPSSDQASAETLEVRAHTQPDTLAGKARSEGGGAAIKAGPSWRAGVGAHPALAPRDGEPRGEGPGIPFLRCDDHHLCRGKCRPPARGAGNGAQTRPMWSAAGVPHPAVSRSPDPGSGPAWGASRALPGKRREFPSRGRGGRAVSFAGVGDASPKQLRGSSRAFTASLCSVCREGGICNEPCVGDAGLET